MLKRLSPRERFEQLVSTYEPMLRSAFIEAIDDIRSNIVLRRIVERLERQDIAGAIRAMNLDDAAFRPWTRRSGRHSTAAVLPRWSRSRRCVIRKGIRSLSGSIPATSRRRPGCGSTRRRWFRTSSPISSKASGTRWRAGFRGATIRPARLSTSSAGSTELQAGARVAFWG
jgi:hypothetical protein